MKRENIYNWALQNYFWLFLMTATAVYVCQQLQFSLPDFVHNHLNDLLCMPIVLNIALRAVRVIKSDAYLSIPLSLQITVTLLFCLYFDWYLPDVNPRYTSDWLDVLCYFTGMVFFYLLNNAFKKEPKQKTLAG